MKFTEQDYHYFKDHPTAVMVSFDGLDETPELHNALKEGIIQVVVDYDRVGTGESGFVHRITGKDFRKK